MHSFRKVVGDLDFINAMKVDYPRLKSGRMPKRDFWNLQVTAKIVLWHAQMHVSISREKKRNTLINLWAGESIQFS